MTDDGVLVAGETLVDMLPAGGAGTDGETFHRHAGGAPANVAVGLARLGDPPQFWTRLGGDRFGDFLATTLADEGVSDTLVERGSGTTALAFTEPGVEGRFRFYASGTETVALDADRVPDGVLDSVGWVHVGGFLLGFPEARRATVRLVERARSRGCTVSFDPNVRPEVFADGETMRAAIDRLVARADVLKVSEEDLSLAGYDFPDPVSALADRGPHTVFRTRGADGASALATEDAPWGAGRFDHDGVPVDAVETTGAGDAFTAGAIAALRDGESLPDALGFAVAAGAAATTAHGAMGALPTHEVVESTRRDVA
ncbi:carbohydrate kinase family protein [Halomarina litorea]|uniref:carbohydrate kinase family protein n=1 Tax=Halomarina litorea TaxID=2961595 RepID=UPI0020C4AB1B|nr:carbohydrate kinase [Halomarina sp. BCD28]